MIPYFGASVYDDPKVYERSSPMTFIRNVHAPTLIVGGDRDAEVPVTQSYEYWNALRRLGVKTEFVVYPDEGHFFLQTCRSGRRRFAPPQLVRYLPEAVT